MEIRAVEEINRDGLKIARAEVPISDSDYFKEADEYLFSTRSRFARNFKEAGIVPKEADYNPVDHAMRNSLDNPALKIEDNRAMQTFMSEISIWRMDLTQLIVLIWMKAMR